MQKARLRPRFSFGPGAAAARRRAREADIIAFCREHLAGFKLPKTVVFSELPKTSTGKIQKYLLRDWAKAL